ncbi:helix-turn-helix domain-containing protein [Parasphaerochaeta coccoides]|uniref:helix-turn-helix domain-containing protein n=1 Tax=Parasphaerochaeta coccoides TaxID=273376 RepID=UPI0011D2A1F2
MAKNHLTLSEKIRIEGMVSQGISFARIAQELGKDRLGFQCPGQRDRFACCLWHAHETGGHLLPDRAPGRTSGRQDA